MRWEGSGGRSLFVLNMTIFFMSAGFYLILPLLGNELIGARGIPVAAVTLILNTRIFTQDLLMLPAGLLADRIGSRNALILGAVSRGMGFLLMAFTSSVPRLLLANLLAGLGGSFFFPASLSLYAGLTDESNRLRVFSIREALNSLGNVVGPLAGTALLFLGFAWVGIASALIFFGSAAAVFFFVDAGKGRRSTLRRGTPGWRAALGDRRFLWFSVILMVVTVYMNQQMIAVPVRVNQIEPGYAYVGVIFSLSSGMMALLQIRLTGLVSKYFSQYRIIGLAAAFYAAGLGVMGIFDGIWALYAGSAVYCIGALLLQPAKNVLISRYAPEGAAGSYFGCQGLVNTFGNLFFSTGLGVFYELSGLPDYRYLPWIVLLAGGIAIVAAVLASERALAPQGKDGAAT